MKHLLAAVLGIVLVAGSAPAAAPAGFLANQGKLKPVVSIANSYSEKVVRIFAGDVGSAAVFDVVPNPEKVSARVVARLGDYNFAGITADTVVAFAAGDFNFRATLAEAATRTIAATGSATFNFSLQIPVLDADGNPRLDANENEMFSTVRLGSMKWTWNASTKMVSATLTLVIPAGGIPDTAGVGGIACAKFAGLAGEGGVRRFANVPLPVTVGFGDAAGSRDVFVGGVTQTRLVQVRGVAADHPDTFPVTAVVLAGAADTRAPQLTVRVPLKVEAGTEAAIFGVLVDRPAPSGYSTPGALGYGEPEVAVYVNQVPGEGVDPDFVLGYSDNRGTALAEDAPGLNAKGTGYLAGETGSLGAGTQTLRFVATDSEGNTSTLVKTVLAPENFILVAGGTLPSSSPLGAVSVQTFYIGKYEIQWGEFQAVRTWAAANGYDIGGAGAGNGSNYPVTDVTWYQALKWCNARSEMEGRMPVYRVSGAVYRTGEVVPDVNMSANGYRLPSDEEWEWAARGGTSSQGYTYSGSNTINNVAWHEANSGGATHLVGTKAPNELGIHDLSGNVWERTGSSATNFEHVRGGSWAFGPVQNSEIHGYSPDRSYHVGQDFGFRLALNAAP